MSFFGSLFASMTLYWQFDITGFALVVPFAVFVVIGLVAIRVIRQPGDGIVPSEKAERAITWSSIGEGIGLFLVSNIVINLHHAELLLPAMALVVGAHFIPIAFAARFLPFYALGAALLLSALIGFIVAAPLGGAISGFMAAAGLWIASMVAVRRDERFKRSSAGYRLWPRHVPKSDCHLTTRFRPFRDHSRFPIANARPSAGSAAPR